MGQNMRQRFLNFMMGRYGMDSLGRSLSVLVMVLLVIGMFVRNGLFSLVALAALIYMYYRVFSRNVSRRYAENQAYLNWRYQVRVKTNKWSTHMRELKHYRFYKCPTCKQKVRVPRGHGRIEISCPKCREKFIRRS